MGRGLKMALFGLGCAVAGFLIGRGNTLSGESLVLSTVRSQVEASTGPFICTLGESSSVRTRLNSAGIQTDKFGDLVTGDDQNMLVVFDGRDLTAIGFTPFGHSFSEEKCSRIGS
jgi:hypothetical protein